MSLRKFWFASNFFSILSFIIYSTVAQPETKVIDVQKQGDLIFAHVLYRHGDRNPRSQSPGDKYDISYWPEGWGQLTNLGKQQHYELGQWLRKRYKGFLSRTYHVNEIYVQSTNVDRTLMSAEANLAGLYPPERNQIWNTSLLWQPIPVHTMPVATDYLITGDVPTSCKSYQRAFDAYMASAELKEFEESLQPFYDYLTTEIGITINDFMTVAHIRDSWFCESIHNLSLPKWTKPLFPHNDEFDQAALKYSYLRTATKFLAKFSSGFLLKDILDRFTKKIEKTLLPDRKLWVYSAHDSTLFNFLNSLNISDNKFVSYAATIILELRRFKRQNYVQIFYKNSDQNPRPIRIPDCGIACPLSKMYEVYDDILPKYDFSTECEIDE